MSPAARELRLWIVLALVLSAAALFTLSPVVGLFHDDAIYTSTAKALAQGEGYRLTNLPTVPYQTKYPPFYAALLSFLWMLFPVFPANVLVLKSTNVVFMGLALVSLARYASTLRIPVAAEMPVASLLIFGSSPALIGFADLTMSDVLFTCLATGSFALWEAAKAQPSRGRETLVLTLTSVSILTRSVGIALVGAIVLDCLFRREIRRACVHALTGASVSVAWLLWTAAHRDASSSLLSYYVEYEKHALSHLTTNAALSFSILYGNARMAWDVLGITLGPTWQVLRLLLPVLLPVGLWRLWRAGGRMPILFGVLYSGLVLMHPFSPHRYLLPLMPLLALTVPAGAYYVWSLLPWRGAVERRRTSPAVVVLTLAILLGNVAWFIYRVRPGTTVKGWYGTDLEYEWSGFEETFGWIKRNTPSDAVLGSMFDPMYYLHTGRRGLRPWLHQPETYFYPYGEPSPNVGHPAQVADELRALGVTYIVLDPYTGYVEGPAVHAMLQEMLRLPEVGARLVFRSSDDRHLVYRLWDHTSPSADTRSPRSMAVDQR